MARKTISKARAFFGELNYVALRVIKLPVRFNRKTI